MVNPVAVKAVDQLPFIVDLMFFKLNARIKFFYYLVHFAFHCINLPKILFSNRLVDNLTFNLGSEVAHKVQKIRLV